MMLVVVVIYVGYRGADEEPVTALLFIVPPLPIEHIYSTLQSSLTNDDIIQCIVLESTTEKVR